MTKSGVNTGCKTVREQKLFFSEIFSNILKRNICLTNGGKKNISYKFIS